MIKKKTILVVCGSGVATSTAAAMELKSKLSERGMDVEIKQSDVFSVKSNLQGVALIASTCALTGDFGVPVVSATSFLTGINEEKTLDEIVEKLK